MANNFPHLRLTPEEEEEYGHDILYAATFRRNEEAYTWFSVFCWIFISIPCILLYGIGFIMLLWTPFIYYIASMDIKSRKLFITSDSIIYIAQPPACIPCLGKNKQEKHVLLSLVTDVILQQGWFANCWGLQSVKIENAGQGVAAGGYDLGFTGIENAKLFKQIVLRAAAAKRQGQSISREDIRHFLNGDFKSTVNSANNNMARDNQVIANQSSQETDAKLDLLNDTMMRIEQLLARQAQQGYNPISLEKNANNSDNSLI